MPITVITFVSQFHIWVKLYQNDLSIQISGTMYCIVPIYTYIFALNLKTLVDETNTIVCPVPSLYGLFTA